MEFVSFRDKPLTAIEWLLLIGSYLVPVISIWMFPNAWFLFPAFAVIFLMLSPRSILVRFNFVQSFFCFVLFTLIITLATFFRTMAPDDQGVFVFILTLFLTLAVSYLVFTVTVFISFIFRRYLKLPFAEQLIRKIAGRYVYGTDAKSRDQS